MYVDDLMNQHSVVRYVRGPVPRLAWVEAKAIGIDLAEGWILFTKHGDRTKENKGKHVYKPTRKNKNRQTYRDMTSIHKLQYQTYRVPLDVHVIQSCAFEEEPV